MKTIKGTKEAKPTNILDLHRFVLSREFRGNSGHLEAVGDEGILERGSNHFNGVNLTVGVYGV